MKYFLLLMFILASSLFSQAEARTILNPEDSIEKASDEINNDSNDSAEYIIRKAIIYKSKMPGEYEIRNTSAKLWLIKIYFIKGKSARPLMLIERDGKKFFVEYEPVRTFEHEEEAIEFGKLNFIRDIELK